MQKNPYQAECNTDTKASYNDMYQEITITEEGEEIHRTKEYGIGIDCHSRFIQVCALVRQDGHFIAYQEEFPTEWNSLLFAKQWCLKVLETKASPSPDLLP